MISSESVLEVLRCAQAPPSNVMIRDWREFSDLFPGWGSADFDQDGPLGFYQGGDPPEESPLHSVTQALRDRRYQIYDQERANDWIRTEQTRAGLFVTMLHMQLVSTIDQAHRNLLEKGYGVEESTDIIAEHINTKDQTCSERYTLALDCMTTELAALERHDPLREKPTEVDGIPILDLEVLLNGSRTPEEERLRRHESLVERIASTKLRQQRLRFEWLSAVTILDVLKQDSVPSASLV